MTTYVLVTGARPGADVTGDELQPVRLRELAGLQHLREPVAFRLALTRDQHAGRRIQCKSDNLGVLPKNQSQDQTPEKNGGRYGQFQSFNKI